MSEQELAAVIVEDVTALEKLRAVLLPLIDRVAICDAALGRDAPRPCGLVCSSRAAAISS